MFCLLLIPSSESQGWEICVRQDEAHIEGGEGVRGDQGDHVLRARTLDDDGPQAVAAEPDRQG